MFGTAPNYIPYPETVVLNKFGWIVFETEDITVWSDYHLLVVEIEKECHFSKQKNYSLRY